MNGPINRASLHPVDLTYDSCKDDPYRTLAQSVWTAVCGAKQCEGAMFFGRIPHPTSEVHSFIRQQKHQVVAAVLIYYCDIRNGVQH